MAMGTERSKALHNFTFPASLRWGNQRFLRCIKVDSGGQVPPLRQFAANDDDSSDHLRQQSIDQRRTTRDGEGEKRSPASNLVPLGSLQVGSTPPPVSDGGCGIIGGEDGRFPTVRKNVKFDVRTAADELKGGSFMDSLKSGEVSVSLLPPTHPLIPQHSAVVLGEEETKTPWNLRKRRAACKTPVSGFVFDSYGDTSSAGAGGKALAWQLTDRSARLRSGGNAAAIGGEKLTREKFSVSLSKREIEQDFLVFTGHRPARRRKKRAKFVQRELDTLFPGLGLTEVTADIYKVSEGGQ